MNIFEFRGPVTNLGRFGMVKAGERLILTEKEAECIRGDKRFKAIDAEISQDEQERLARLSIAEMNREELVEYCEALQRVDPNFQFRRDLDHRTLLALVRQRLEQQTKNPA